MAELIPYEKRPDGTYRDTFCTCCWTHERHFKGGHSWAPDLCDCGCEDTIIWEKMSWYQRSLARVMFKTREDEKNDERTAKKSQEAHS